MRVAIKFIGKSIRRKFVKNANERGHKILPKNSNVRPPGNSETSTDSAMVYVLRRFALSFQRKKYVCDWSPDEGENSVYLTHPRILRFSPLYLQNASNDPQIFFHLYVERPDIGQAAKL